MTANIRLGSVWGIPIGLNNSWFVIFALVIFSLSSGYFPAEYPQLSTLAHVGLAALTAVGLFGSVLLHELGHALVALRNGIAVKGITLFLFGGVAQISREPHTPGAEFRIAIAGPLVSFGLAGFFGALWLLDRHIPLLAAPSLYLMRINLILALFNMVPGYPLDGGRVLRALIWKLSGNQGRATRIASGAGQVVAYSFFGLGALTILSGNLFNGLWLILIGGFLLNAASAASSQVTVQEKLRGVTVAQAMERNLATVPLWATLQQIVAERVLQRGEASFLVVDNGSQAQGLLTLEDITRTPQARWPLTTAAQVMVPLRQVLQIEAEQDLLRALQKMEEMEAHHAAVMEWNRLIGVLSREQVLRYLRMRNALGV